jgi:hypothetical protein
MVNRTRCGAASSTATSTAYCPGGSELSRCKANQNFAAPFNWRRSLRMGLLPSYWGAFSGSQAAVTWVCCVASATLPTR